MLLEQVRNFIIFLGLALPLSSIGQSISPLPERFIAKDHGKAQAFIIAADELARPQADGHFQVETENVIKTLQAQKSKTVSSEAQLVLYPSGKTRTVFNRRLLTEKILVEMAPGSDAAALADRMGIVKWEPTPALKNHYIFWTTSSQKALETLESFRAESGVFSAEPILARQQKRRGRPNDPFFGLQWHLYNTGQTGGLSGVDAGVLGIWGTFGGAGIRGTGVVIGIVDDGVQFTHPDLRTNYDTTLDYDWNDNTHFDPTPSERNGDFHGTSVAGVAAARGNNRFGVCGVAPNAKLTGLRLIASYEDDPTEAEAFLYKSDRIAVKNNSWGPDDDGQTMEAPGPIAAQALIDATTSGRNGLGTIFVWAAGNGRAETDNSNYDGYANSIYTIAVTAINFRGRETYYAEKGANVIVAAPSDDYANSGIVTTDLTGENGYNYTGVRGELSDRNYTKTFGGTSSATPVVSGVTALMLQANPNLGWRDVQEVLLRSATKINPSSPKWVTNGAGFRFNKEFGAGLVNATRAVQFASNWTNLAPQTRQSQSNPGAGPIPDGSGAVIRTFNFPTTQRVEHVTVKLQITHPYRGQLRITLTSPSGTVSELAEKHNDPFADIDWTYMTVRNWGENSDGTWILKIEDLTLGKIGRLDSAEMTIFGTDTAP